MEDLMAQVAVRKDVIASESPRNDPHLLIVDTDQSATGTLVRLLVQRGWRPTLARPEEVKSLGRLPDLALVDICPDGVARLDLLRDIREANPGIRVVALTSYASMAVAVAAVRAGAECCLLKPVSPAELDHLLGNPAPDNPGREMSQPSLPRLDAVEWEYISRVLAFHAGNTSATARTLGIRRSTLQRRLKKLPPGC